MVCGPYNEAYFVTLSENENYHINCISLPNDHDFRLETVYQHTERIEAMQFVNHDKLTQEDF